MYDQLLKAFEQLPSGLSFEEFCSHPAIEALNIGPFMLRECFETYEMPAIVKSLPLAPGS